MIIILYNNVLWIQYEHSIFAINNILLLLKIIYTIYTAHTKRRLVIINNYTYYYLGSGCDWWVPDLQSWSTVSLPQGSTVSLPQGNTVSLPQGSTVSLPQGSTVSLPQGSTVSFLPPSSGWLHVLPQDQVVTRLLSLPTFNGSLNISLVRSAARVSHLMPNGDTRCIIFVCFFNAFVTETLICKKDHRCIHQCTYIGIQGKCKGHIHYMKSQTV